MNKVHVAVHWDDKVRHYYFATRNEAGKYIHDIPKALGIPFEVEYIK